MAYFQINSLDIDFLFLSSWIISLCYITVMIWITQGWRKIPEEITQSGTSNPRITVLIAARDEEETLPLLIQDLEKQTYPFDRFEVVIIDDHSRKPLSMHPAISGTSLSNLRLLNAPSSGTGKKCALLYGAENSQFEYLLFTDADCRVDPRWISSFAGFIEQENPDLAIGLVDQPAGRDIFTIFFRLEFLSLVMAGAGTAGQGHPTLCNGANLLVRKSLYLAQKEKLQLQERSGDDVFLLHALKRSGNPRILVLKNFYARVSSRGPSDMYQFFHQRLRWASKSPSYRDKDTIALSLLIFLFNTWLLIILIAALLDPSRRSLLWLIFAGKLMVDFWMLYPGLKFFGKKAHLLLLPFFEVFYPFYIFFTALGSFFIPYRWKTDRVSPRR